MYKHSGDFKHQSVRDLAWALSAPPLISGACSHCLWPDSRWYQQLYQQSLTWLNRVDADPSELDELLHRQKDRRLGKYFETLWFYWLSHNQRYELIEHNLQLIIDGETLGEIDFIVFDKTMKKTIHWELAVKFYLGVGDTCEMKNWHGPGLRDRLDIKVGHLLRRQSAVSRNQRVQQWLQQQGIVIDLCAVILKGRLYYPWELFVSTLQQGVSLVSVSPQLCSRETVHGYWLKQDEFDEKFDEKQRFIPLINQGWLEKMPASKVNKTCSKADIFEMLLSHNLRLPLHLMLCLPENEVERVFLMDTDWSQSIPDKIAGL